MKVVQLGKFRVQMLTTKLLMYIRKYVVTIINILNKWQNPNAVFMKDKIIAVLVTRE